MTNDIIETAWCPCQEVEFAVRHPNIPPRDMPYIDSIDRLERVHTKSYWERERSKASSSNGLSRVPAGPATPRTRRGVKIIDDNFPEADFVCPCCEQTFVEETTVRKQ